MKKPQIARAALLAMLLTVLPGVAAAQFPPPPPPPGSPPQVRNRWPEPPKPKAEPLKPQKPAPMRQPAAAAKPAPAKNKPAPAKKMARPRAPSNAVACVGVFAKDSSHLKLATKYDSRNIVYGQVDGPDGSKINASILYPNDSKRRLEVLWKNEAGRSDTSVIAINGRSRWTAPKGLRLGLSLAALEKANGKPFKLTGFGTDGSASVADWDNGALAILPGGCRVGMRLVADTKASKDARNAVAGDKEFRSNDAAVRAVKPTIAEILIGY
jgi:hypothetical protein